MYKENEEKDQDRAFDAYDHFKKFGYILFPENKKIYEYIAKNCADGFILEAGCGNGVGSGILQHNTRSPIIATDKLESNIKFAKELYSYIEFGVWDIGEEAYHTKHDVVVCVEAIEHVKKYKEAIKNLIASAKNEVWISTPIVENPERPPSNPYHVREFTEQEFLELIGDYEVEIPFRGLFRIKL